MLLTEPHLPVSLYIHIPWCVKKCPYCDFNSHSLRHNLPEKEYLKILLEDFYLLQKYLQNRPIHSIFIGGGTPSLCSPDFYYQLLNSIHRCVSFNTEIEITLEANPGTVEQQRFSGFRAAGINRLSLGIQSFSAEKLRALGRIHDDIQARKAIEAAFLAGFENINLDLMYGLPKQTIDEAMADLQQAVSLNPTHISWYQLTLEPNTYFYQFPPVLPEHDELFLIQEQGQNILSLSGFQQYEISAYCRLNQNCQHNMNYWEYGDYIGIGAGAHGKITDIENKSIQRHSWIKHPKFFMDTSLTDRINFKIVDRNEQALEFFMNTFRLQQPIPVAWLSQKTQLQIDDISSWLKVAEEKKLLFIQNNFFCLTPLGKLFLNDLLEMLLS